MKRLVCFHHCFVLAVVAITLTGCGGVWLDPIGAKIQDADRKFDTAGAFRIKADKDKARETWRGQVEQKKSLYDDALNAYRAIVKAEPTGKYAQRSLWQISEIYKRRYEWDKVIESYKAILAMAPSGSYAQRAKTAIADIHKYRRLIEEKRRRYQEYSALYAQDNAWTNLEIAFQALYDVANSYEQLGDYPQAISNYQRLADEFPAHYKAMRALSKVGDLHLYKLYDYLGARRAYSKVIEKYPGFSSTREHRLRNEIWCYLHEIGQCEAVIRAHRKKGGIPYAGHSAMADFDKNFFRNLATVVRAYKTIARHWETLRNYPAAIVAHQEFVDQLYPGGPADTLYQIARLYQLNEQFEQAIDTYQHLLQYRGGLSAHSEWIYQQAVCYREIREFAKAYEAFKAHISLGSSFNYYQEAEQIVRQFEMDEDGDGYKSYIEQDAGTSDQDPHDHPRVKS